MERSEGDNMMNEIRNAEREKISLKKSTEYKKRHQINEIMEMGDDMIKNPSKPEFIKVPWYKKLGRFFVKFFTKVRV